MMLFCLRDFVRKNIAYIQSSEPVKHLRNANKEVLLAVRSFIDMAICEIDKSEKKTEVNNRTES